MAQEPKDPLAASGKNKGLCGGLHTATLATTDLATYQKFYVDALGMTLEGPLHISSETKELQRKLWKIEERIDWDTYLLHRPEVDELIQIRLMVLDTDTPLIHQSFDCRELGPFSLGFPNGAQEKLDKDLRALGINSMAPLQEGTVERPDGSAYRYIETIYQGPDYLHVVGIERMDGMPQLAPIDPGTKMGGPAYSAMVVDKSDEMMDFLTQVLDLELRADRVWETSEGSALGIEPGVPFRFALVYPKGDNHRHLLFLDYHDKIFIDPGVSPRIPNRGLGMWTFESRDVHAVWDKAKIHGSSIIHEPADYIDPILGEVKVLTLLAPNGFLIEVFQK